MSTPPASPRPPYGRAPTASAPRHPDRGAVVLAVLLIALGVFFLIVNYLPVGGSALFVLLGAAFLVGRITTGQYGFAVPAGVLLGFGSFVLLSELRLFPGAEEGWFFLLLGLGFLAVYLIGARPGAIWPLFPAAVLAGVGLVLQAGPTLGWLAGLSWLIAYWPVALILIGVWLIVRGLLPPALARILGVLGLALLVLYGVVAVAAAVAAPGGPEVGPARIGLPWLGAAQTDTVTLSAPLGSGQLLRTVNTSGRTTIRAGGAGAVRVTAVRHFWSSDQRPDVRLAPSGDALVLETVRPERTFFGGAPWADYDVEVPPGTTVEVRTTSGDVAVRGLSGNVQVQSSSGDVTLNEIAGSAEVRTSSGDVALNAVRGELRVQTTSGSVRGANLERPREVATSSGAVTLEGTFAADARITTTSGDVELRFAPASSVRLDVATTSGELALRGLALTDQRQERRSLSGTLGAGAGLLTVRTTSGDVTLAAGSSG